MREPTIRVLLVEADVGDALLVARRMELELGSLEHVQLERAATLQQGIDRIGKRATDVVLLDLHLPDSAGIDTVRRLREADPIVPIVVFTSSDVGDIPVRALQAGVQDYLDKGDFEAGPLIHRCLRFAIERARIDGEKQSRKSQLEEAERVHSLGVLATGAAFGFNQLIGAILDHTDDALAELSGAVQASRVQRLLLEVRKAALGAAEFSAQLRDFARPDRPSTLPLDLSEFVRSVRPQLEAIAGPEIAIECDLEHPGPSVWAHSLDLRQLLHNLVINASEAIRPDRGRIRVQTGSIWAEPELLAKGCGAVDLPEGRYTCLSVSDTGPGIDRDTAARIFDPFFTTKFAGRGMGLAAALGVVRRHRGRICGEDDPAGGARFQVLFPSEA